ncbi:MAG: hypothetical protein ACR2LI_17225 [Propionibacteriaceae bacterium]
METARRRKRTRRGPSRASEEEILAGGRRLAARLGVELVDVVPPRIEPTLGISVTLPAADQPATHRLVTIGDSLTEGFQHAAIRSAALSWPAILAYQLGTTIRQPHYDHYLGGNPFNLEFLTRRFGCGWVGNLVTTLEFLVGVARHYGGRRARFPAPTDPPNENLSVWGWDLRDALDRTADTEWAEARGVGRLLPRLPTNAWSAVTVLNSSRHDGWGLSMFEAAEQLSQDPGGIETLCVWLGSNNILGTVLDLDVVPSGPGFAHVDTKKRFNAWTVAHFTTELAHVVARTRQITARHVLWGTVPHVTIPPVTHGIEPRLQACDRYFSYYARPWQREDTFHADIDRHLTGGQAWAIDMAVDGYNRAIVEVVATARRAGLDWQVVDVGAALDQLATRRNQASSAAYPNAGAPDPLPVEYTGLSTLFFGSDDDGVRTQGGLFGLDGVHPSTAAYGIVAASFLEVITGTDVAVVGPDGARVDFTRVLAHDTLNQDPPPGLDRLRRWLGDLDRRLDPLQRLLGRGRLPI